MTKTIHNYHLDQIAARLEGHEIPSPRWFDGSCVYWRDGAPCGEETAELLVPTHGDGHPAYPVCADHLREFLVDHLMVSGEQGESE